ncbi:MAG: hypothetical protein AAFX52_11910 [Pseudomonadota bacterium]
MNDFVQGDDPETTLTQNEIDLRDMAVEVATDGNGPKQKRFLVGDKDPKAIERKEEEQRRQLHAVLLQMASADQIAATLLRLDDLQSRLDNAFADLEDWRADIESRTARLADGTAIYRRDDGRFETADGTIVPDDQLPDDNPENAVTAEQWRAFLDRARRLGLAQEKVDQGREIISGEDVTIEDLEKIDALIVEAEAAMELQSDIAPLDKDTTSPRQGILSFDDFSPAPA